MFMPSYSVKIRKDTNKHSRKFQLFPEVGMEEKMSVRASTRNEGDEERDGRDRGGDGSPGPLVNDSPESSEFTSSIRPSSCNCT